MKTTTTTTTTVPTISIILIFIMIFIVIYYCYRKKIKKNFVIPMSINNENYSGFNLEEL